MDKATIMKKIMENGVLAVIRKVPEKDVEQVAESLIKGGVNVLEVTLDAENANQIIQTLSNKFAGKAVVGAGTVLDAPSARTAIEHGAQFVVSPLLEQEVIEATLALDKVSVPGIMTPTEAMTAVKLGADIVKVFPASAVGPSFLKNVKGPLPDITMIPTGGITTENAADFIKAGAAAVGAGGNLVDNKAIREGNFTQIEQVAAKYKETVRQARETM
ncbi:bifunctional 4-hydroxy-2-oxoglutarate aldolase/2-dehydro-3-deoxy-phosphogluconate aldolase [Sediminibacillus dalangtanensis]|uniref:Bifunctional 4-hydroxy-2-oxoglutarate aldolase/2-dehydro-3-deoxy-phosphogluconate aldolase n=1 Tax=Sediminibacillus dalangtanensis TaxID=2729421 RepID=A0ABX7VQJ0_9BACI|nr:bifunctional 4-hydroxy-2-oxoglutarate aldolase/2-dehydro-3-deoxy-phosphogluconate aldolase [Sediminibacillus dalangtanensis]QTM99169.1 bifunctional 4-hydroxy-2-oxoglutarate aldolase/2-dehydro-3-deoxy-phosphogluconate aldolase [Sediminibacillus dalangtanensis]